MRCSRTPTPTRPVAWSLATPLRSHSRDRSRDRTSRAVAPSPISPCPAGGPGTRLAPPREPALPAGCIVGTGSGGGRGALTSGQRVLFAFMPALISACATPASSPPRPIPFSSESALAPSSDRSDCLRLESRLSQLTHAADPVAFAAVARIDVRGGQALVLVELQAGVTLTDLHDMTVESRSGDVLQAR